jgi:hypothetical protein
MIANDFRGQKGEIKSPQKLFDNTRKKKSKTIPPMGVVYTKKEGQNEEEHLRFRGFCDDGDRLWS